MANLDFDQSKKFLVFLACANPRVFKNYIRIENPPSSLLSYSSNYTLGSDATAEPADPAPVYPTYITFTPPTSRFPNGPPQLRRSYPPPPPPKLPTPPPSPVIIDAVPTHLPSGPTDPAVEPHIHTAVPPPTQQSSHARDGPKVRPTSRAGRKSKHAPKAKSPGAAAARRNFAGIRPTTKAARKSSNVGSSRRSPSENPSSHQSTGSSRGFSRRGQHGSRSSGETANHASFWRLRAKLRAAVRRINPSNAISRVPNPRYYLVVE